MHCSERLTLKYKATYLCLFDSSNHMSWKWFFIADSKQYHNTRRKRMLRRFKLNQLQAKLEVCVWQDKHGIFSVALLLIVYRIIP